MTTTTADVPADQRAFGIDVGGTGIKGGIVDLSTGALIGERLKIATPQPATPAAVAETAAELTRRFEWDGPVGLTLPSVVKDGVALTAANIDKAWIGTDARALFSEALGGRAVRVLNDADAAGLAEYHYGAGKDVSGLVILLTFGTGIGSAIIHDGVLLPNTEFGHMELDGDDAEHSAAASVRDERHLSWDEWTPYVSRFLRKMEDLFWPDLFIAGGGVSRKGHKWIPLLDNRTNVVAATLKNTAGIVGAAMAVAADLPN
ncbi:polyphosphate--glucose phosphotransferase [Rhodococcus sp. X156]|uniref:polyphosphate--glucose phosphotransferase n=1 Tax=Rhodococcus sp. X156 TaxID=2499145 RepID=UPI0019CF50A4|nr:ROK family protein [Rhodococcus sp. X156]